MEYSRDTVSVMDICTCLQGGASTSGRKAAAEEARSPPAVRFPLATSGSGALQSPFQEAGSYAACMILPVAYSA